MEFSVVLVCTLAFCLALRNPIKKYPVLFYSLAALTVLAFFAGMYGYLGTLWKPLILLVQRCMVALALFTVVMFIGVLPKGSRLYSWLNPIRAELSIMAFIMCLGHIIMYLSAYAGRALSGSLSGSILISFMVAVVLFILLMVLGATSFNTVKRFMSGSAWKNVQRFAYLFFLLVYVHLLLMLAPAAALGGRQAIFSVVIYSTIFLLYIVMRLSRYFSDKKALYRAAEQQGQESY